MDTAVLFVFWRFKNAYKKAKMCSEVPPLLLDSKLFGYMDSGLIAAFYEFNRHLVPNGQQPVWVFYFEGDDSSRALRFFPGEEKVEFLCGKTL